MSGMDAQSGGLCRPAPPYPDQSVIIGAIAIVAFALDFFAIQSSRRQAQASNSTIGASGWRTNLPALAASRLQ
jgi:hypothetical protein